MNFFAALYFLVAIRLCMGTTPYYLKCDSKEMVKGKWNDTNRFGDKKGYCYVHSPYLRCISFKCSIGGRDDGLTLNLVRGCEKPDGALDCDELTKQCMDAGGKPSKCRKCRGLYASSCNEAIRPAVVCLSGRKNANESGRQVFAPQVCEEGEECFTMSCYDGELEYGDHGRIPRLLYQVKGCSWDEKHDWTRMRRECEFAYFSACAESCCNGEEEEEPICDALYESTPTTTSSSSSTVSDWASSAYQMSKSIGNSNFFSIIIFLTTIVI